MRVYYRACAYLNACLSVLHERGLLECKISGWSIVECVHTGMLQELDAVTGRMLPRELNLQAPDDFMDFDTLDTGFLGDRSKSAYPLLIIMTLQFHG